MCPKRVLCSKKERLTILICEAIMKLNVGVSYQKALLGNLCNEATPL